MSKWWHVLATIGMAAAVAAVPGIQTALSGHVVVTSILGGVWAVLGNLLQSPLPPKAS